MEDFHLFAAGPRPVAPFSHAVEADGWVILTGQMPTDPDAPEAPLPEGIAAQTRRVMDNLALVLGETGLDLSHVVQCRAYLTDFARDYGLGYDEIVAANPGVDPWLPGEGTKVLLPTQYILPDAPRKGVVINLATLRLFYYPEPDTDGAQYVLTHPIGIGREGWRTPQGRFRITQKLEDPAWRVPA